MSRRGASLQRPVRVFGVARGQMSHARAVVGGSCQRDVRLSLVDAAPRLAPDHAEQEETKGLPVLTDTSDAALCALPARYALCFWFVLCVVCLVVCGGARGIQIIASRVRKGEYHSLGAFEADVMLLFDNAREYNVEGSMVYQVSFCYASFCCFSGVPLFFSSFFLLVVVKVVFFRPLRSISRIGPAATRCCRRRVFCGPAWVCFCFIFRAERVSSVPILGCFGARLTRHHRLAAPAPNLNPLAPLRIV